MSGKELKIVLVIALIIILAICFVVARKSKSENANYSSESRVVYNEVDNTYTILDEKNNERAVVHSEEEAQKYIDNPDYDPGIPETTTIVTPNLTDGSEMEETPFTTITEMIPN